MSECKCCQGPLTRDDIALHKKLVNRASTEFMCEGCLAEYYSVSVELLRQKKEEFKKQGCTLFA